MNTKLSEITVTDITDIITFSSPKGRHKTIQNRGHFGISFCTEGQITYTMDNQKFISDKSCAVILPKGQSYDLYGDKNGIFPVINFECLNFSCNSIMCIPIENSESYIKNYEQMKSLFLFEKNRAKIISIFYNILHHLSLSSNPQPSVLAPAIKYIENNYSDFSLNNTILARQCEISEVYFRKLFSEHYSITPKQFVMDIRIDKAKQLLTDGILKINAIAESCGFSNQYHFCRIFKERTGLSPSDYMKQNKIHKI